jgi:sulfite reductase (NADPH) flavoprotein alpha-component
MSPIALTSSLTSPPGVPVQKSQIAAANLYNSLTLDGTETPYSTTSTAVSEYEGKSTGTASPILRSPTSAAKALVDAALPSSRTVDGNYFSNLLASSAPVPSTKAGATVYGSAIDVLEAFAVQQSKATWVYDDAVEVGFGRRVESFGGLPVQTRQGAGLELAGYAAKSTGKISVFATTSTLSSLLPSLASISGDITVHLATTAPSDSLELTDSLYAPGVIKSLASIDNWEVVFSSGDEIVSNAAKLYGREGKVIHVVESTHAGREVSSYTFPSVRAGDIGFTLRGDAEDVFVVPSGHVVPSGSVLSLNTLVPSPDALVAALAGKNVSVVGGTKADADALKAVVLSAIYSASTSSKTALPVVKSMLVPPITPARSGKTVSFYTFNSPLPELVAHVFLSSPSLSTRLAQFGSVTRGVKSVLSLAPSSSPSTALSVDEPSDVAWVSDANLLKSTDVFSSMVAGGIVVLELPWTEEELLVKLTRAEIAAIQSKKLRVFLLDLDPAHHLNPIRETVAFMLLYTGASKLPAGVLRVLDAFFSDDLGRDEIEDAYAALIEVEPSSWTVPDDDKLEKPKAVWTFDALPGQSVDLAEDEKPQLASWDLAARHLLFREAFSDAEISALRPSTSDQTFLVTVSENRRLTPVTYDRNVFHLELDTAGTGLKYEIGEAIGIHGWNDTDEVLDFCSWYGVEPEALVSFPNLLKAGTMETRTVFQLLQQNIDLFGRPGKAFYAALAKLATSRADAMTLKFISAPEGAELFKRMSEKETVTFADVLRRFRTARPSIEELVGLVPEIKPRHYSIASSQKAVGDKVELLIVTVDWISSKGSPRFGQCTRYLAALKPGAKVTVSIKPSVMKLPPDNRQPIIMAGLGTGAAPFRAFMQHRAWQRSQGVEVGPLIYYFGSRYRSQEYLYGEEIEAYIASGIISHAGLAFSRDGKDKVYIQHKMMEDQAMLASMLQGKGKDAAYFYLCGPTWPVPDVYEALVGSLVEKAGIERKRAEEYIEELKEEERYVLEVY